MFSFDTHCPVVTRIGFGRVGIGCSVGSVRGTECRRCVLERFVQCRNYRRLGVVVSQYSLPCVARSRGCSDGFESRSARGTVTGRADSGSQFHSVRVTSAGGLNPRSRSSRRTSSRMNSVFVRCQSVLMISSKASSSDRGTGMFQYVIF